MLSLLVRAQISETFSGLTLTPTTIGSSTVNLGGVPTGWQQLNLDLLSPHSSLLPYMGTNGWITREITYANNTKDTVAMSISYYNPVGISNDWLISPQFSVPMPTSSDEVWLTWEGYTPDASYPDGYVVKLSTTGTATTDFTTTLTTIAAENSTGFAKHAVNLSSYAGQNVYIAFVNNSNDKYILFIDDIKTEMVSGYDGELLSVNIKRYEKTSTNVTISGQIQNNGKTITAMNIDWTDGGAPNTATLAGLNIAPFATYNFSHTVPFNKAVADEFNIDVSIAQVNGGVTETNTTNNTASGIISTVANAPVRNVLFEEGTGTWCGWCPRGAVAMEDLYHNITDGTFIGIAVHNGDPMTVAAYDNSANFGGYPSSNIDRVMLDQNVSTASWNSYYNTRKVVVAPASVSHTLNYDNVSRILTVNCTANFNTKISSGIRLGAIVVENGVQNAAYNQSNYYANNANGVMGGFEALPNPVPGSQMTYMHVGRALLGGYDGQAGSVTSPVANGGTANYTFTYTVPSTQVETHLTVVSVLIDETTGEIMNAKESWVFDPIATGDIVKNNTEFVVYPTLINGNSMNIKFNADHYQSEIEIYSSTGAKVFSQNLGKLSGQQNLSINLPDLANGSYLVSLKTPNQSDVRIINIAK